MVRAASDSIIQLKRAYEPAAESDGYRVLVERLWPRGLQGRTLHLDAWLKDVTPSTTLRQWFAHDEARFGRLAERYKRELASRPRTSASKSSSSAPGAGDARLSTRNPVHNNAVVLASDGNRAPPLRANAGAPSPALHATLTRESQVAERRQAPTSVVDLNERQSLYVVVRDWRLGICSGLIGNPGVNSGTAPQRYTRVTSRTMHWSPPPIPWAVGTGKRRTVGKPAKPGGLRVRKPAIHPCTGRHPPATEDLSASRGRVEGPLWCARLS